ncbi:MAG: hypothetical protein AAGM46_27420, partial [Cyanobacteria bacterium J06582_2]
HARRGSFALRCRPDAILALKIFTYQKLNEIMPAQKECSCHRQYSVKEHIMTNSERNDGCTQECRDDSQYPAKLMDPWWFQHLSFD